MMQTTTRNIKTVVVIDDDVWLAKAIEQVLIQEGFSVHLFNNGRGALECLARESVDLVVTDIYMEQMDGMEIIRAVKESHPAVKIIVMSGGSQMVDMDCLTVAEMIGADRALAKPIKMARLLEVVAELDAKIGTPPCPSRLKSVADLP